MKAARQAAEVALAAVVAVVLCCGDAKASDWQTFVDTTRADKWTGLDKGMHFGAGAAVSAGALVFKRTPHEAFAIGVGVAAAKEFYDVRHKARHSSSGKDFAVTVVGAAVGAYVPGLVLGPRFIGYSRSF